jgi:hypothetical protein
VGVWPSQRLKAELVGARAAGFVVSAIGRAVTSRSGDVMISHASEKRE